MDKYFIIYKYNRTFEVYYGYFRSFFWKQCCLRSWLQKTHGCCATVVVHKLVLTCYIIGKKKTDILLLLPVYKHSLSESIFRRVKRRDRSGLGVRFTFFFTSCTRAASYKNACSDILTCLVSLLFSIFPLLCYWWKIQVNIINIRAKIRN